MSKTTKPAKTAVALSTLADRAAEAVLQATRAQLLDIGTVTGENDDSYDNLLRAAGLTFDEDVAENAFRRALPADDGLQRAFTAILERRNKNEYGRERASYQLGIAIGKRLAGMGGAR